MLVYALDTLLVCSMVLVLESRHARGCSRNVVLWGWSVCSADTFADASVCLLVALVLAHATDTLGHEGQQRPSAWLTRTHNCVSGLYYHVIVAGYLLPYYALVRTGLLPMCTYSVVVLFACANLSLRIVQYCVSS